MSFKTVQNIYLPILGLPHFQINLKLWKISGHFFFFLSQDQSDSFDFLYQSQDNIITFEMSQSRFFFWKSNLTFFYTVTKTCGFTNPVYLKNLILTDFKTFKQNFLAFGQALQNS